MLQVRFKKECDNAQSYCLFNSRAYKLKDLMKWTEKYWNIKNTYLGHEHAYCQEEYHASVKKCLFILCQQHLLGDKHEIWHKLCLMLNCFKHYFYIAYENFLHRWKGFLPLNVLSKCCQCKIRQENWKEVCLVSCKQILPAKCHSITNWTQVLGHLKYSLLTGRNWCQLNRGAIITIGKISVFLYEQTTGVTVLVDVLMYSKLNSHKIHCWIYILKMLLWWKKTDILVT